MTVPILLLLSMADHSCAEIMADCLAKLPPEVRYACTQMQDDCVKIKAAP